jgi:DNA primase
MNLEKEIKDLFLNHNIYISSNTGEEINVFCPFHKNSNSAAMYINIKTGLWQCFNPSCAKKGNFRQLYYGITGKSFGKSYSIDPYNLDKELNKYKNEYVVDNSLNIDSIAIDYDKDAYLLDTLIERGLSLDTLKYFEVGYSKEKNRVVIPVRSASYELVGFIGRATLDSQQPRYLYNKGFRRADYLFNLQNAKAHGDVIIVEGSIDAMFVHQAGFNNVVASLGAAIPKSQIVLLKKYFDKIIIFSDNDMAGEAMRDGIIEQCLGKNISVAEVSKGLKDPGEMNTEQIQNAIKFAKHII